MSASMIERYGHPAMVLAAAWIVVLSGIVLIDHGRWRNLTSQLQANTLGRELHTLQTRVDTFERQLADEKAQPAPISVQRFSEMSHALDERLTHLEQEGSHRASQQELDTLASRVAALELSRAHPVGAARSSAPAQPTTNTSISTPAEPPFRVLGLEMRGGERFLSIAPPKAVSLGETSVLRVGDVQDGWQLEALDRKTATFRFQGQSRQLTLP